MISEERRTIAAEQLAVIQQADAFERLLETDGWRALYAFHESWAEQYARAARKVETKDSAAAVDALRQWQLAEEFLRLQADYINRTIAQARDILGTRTLEEALLQEQLQHEQPEPTRTADSGGY